ncbi:MAG TPA: TRAP transporter small permease [Paracoccus sp. (in: a-proteobacteria)]|nr:TRAP transporter small permease [Paracoccus sp. (in: a-proteobacteria)]
MSGIESDSRPVAGRGPTARAAALIDGLARWAGAVLLAVLAGMVIYVVAARYLFATTPRWSEELPRLLLVWATFLGAASGFARGGHFRAGLRDLVVGPGPVRRAAHLLAAVATALFLVTLIWTGARLTLMTWPHSTTALNMPGGLFYVLLPVGGALALAGVLLAGGRE